MFEPEDEAAPMDGGDEPMMKEAKSGALREILDLLTRMEMEQHAPKAPEAAPPEMGEEMPMEPEGGGGGALSPEDIEMIKAKLDTMA